MGKSVKRKDGAYSDSEEARVLEMKKQAKEKAKKVRKMKESIEDEFDEDFELPDADADEEENYYHGEDDNERRRNGNSTTTTNTDSDKAENDDEKQELTLKTHPEPGEFPLSNTKVYMGNLSWQIDDDSLKEAFADIGEIKSIVWMEEKLTKKFLGAGVVEFSSEEEREKAVESSGRIVLKRECKIRRWEQRGNTAEERAAAAERGETLPSSNNLTKNSTNSNKKPQKKFPEMGEKPEGCYTLFMGNLDFNMTDDFIWEFFKENAGAEMLKVRWLENRDTGEFRGQGYADFKKEEIDQAAALHNTPCMGGRPIKLDWQAPRGSY